jgi:DMSO reductase anchor subunit
VLIYAATRRTWWRAPRTAGRFAFTTLAFGLAVALIGAAADGDPLARRLAVALALLSATALAVQAALMRHLGRESDLGRTATLLAGELRRPFRVRLAGGVLGGVAAPLMVLAGPPVVLASLVAALGLVVLVAGELCERWLFFTAVAGPRMPGALR